MQEGAGNGLSDFPHSYLSMSMLYSVYHPETSKSDESPCPDPSPEIALKLEQASLLVPIKDRHNVVATTHQVNLAMYC